METIRNEIKSHIARSGMTMVAIAKIWNVRHPEDPTTPQNIANKLTRGTIKYSEVREIADIIGYEITWIKKNS